MWGMITRLRNSKRAHKILLTVGLFLLCGGGFIYLWIFHDLPSLDELDAGLALPSTRIYDRDGALLYEILPPEQGRNTALALDEIPAHCINALIATEDANYYKHPGVDAEGILRALWINLRGGDVIAGGSTITQQAARLLLLDPQQQAQRTVQRKLKEMVLALQLNRIGKDAVLELYLNQVYFGNLAYGIEGAARAYFHKSARELSLAECSLLAGIIQNAVYNDPLTQFERAKERQEVALRLMVQENFITQAQAASAQQDELQFGATRFPIEAPHFVMAIWKQLEREFPQQLYSGGLDVVTTLDLDWQRTAQHIAQQQLAVLNDPSLRPVVANARNAALVAMNPQTGEVLTMLGSPDYFNEDTDGAVNAALAMRQPGSTLKPFTYAAAMDPTRDAPYTAATVLMDVETPFVTRRLESYTPSNYGLAEHGPVRVREALASSMNIPAVVALEHVGLTDFTSLVGNLGLEELDQNTDVDLSITLGGGEIRLLDLVQAYSAFPNGGHRVEPTMLLEVRQRDGTLLHAWQPPSLTQRVLDERVAYIITDILSDPDARLAGFGQNSPLQIGRPAAAKTGTTTDFRDNWVVGYTPELVVGVWVGNADNTPMVEVTGVDGAGPIWNLFVRRVLLDTPQRDFRVPDGLTRREVCSLSGLLPTDSCPYTVVEWFIEGTEPTEYDNFYQTFTIDTRTGLLANDSIPDEHKAAQTFVVLPQEARDWAARNGLRQPPIGAVVQLPDAEAPLRLLEPDPYTLFELSPILPIAAQRLKLQVGAPPDAASVTYRLNGDVVGTSEAAPWHVWWSLELGQHELVAEARLADGSRVTSEAIPFSVVEYEPPRSRTVQR